MTARLTATIEDRRFPIAGSFRIARGAKTEAYVLEVRLHCDGVSGWGEAVPYARYDETVPDSMEQLRAAVPMLSDSLSSVQAEDPGLSIAEAVGKTRQMLHTMLQSGAVRNALDCALWDLQSALSGIPVAELAGLPGIGTEPIVTAETISIDIPERMAAAAKAKADRPLLKIKLGAEQPEACLRAVRDAAPKAALIVDANEAWDPADLPALFATCAALDVAMIEQPLPADQDAALAAIDRPVPVFADESCHGPEDLELVSRRYDGVNIKLDKTGGLTAALVTEATARAYNLDVMIGCMVGSSLSMAPALLLAHNAQFVDLDGPVLLANDRNGGLRFHLGRIIPGPSSLWGGGVDRASFA